jgi:hypothetical protein
MVFLSEKLQLSVWRGRAILINHFIVDPHGVISYLLF